MTRKRRPPIPGITIVVGRRLPAAASNCCTPPWRSITVDYEHPADGCLRMWQTVCDARATHGQALYHYLRSRKEFAGRVRRTKYTAVVVHVYRGKGSKEDHALFERLERRIKRLANLSTAELVRRRHPNPARLP